MHPIEAERSDGSARLVPGRFGRWFQSWPFAAGMLALAALAIVLAAIPEIFVPDTALGWADAWYYVGFAQRLPDSMRQYSSLYQGERVSWTVPGYLVNQLATPIPANYILKGLYFAATVFFLFGALRQTCRLRTAAFVSALASVYSFVAHSLGANYVDGAANTYFLIAVYAANRAALGAGFVASAFVAGVACVALLLSQVAYVVVLPLFAGYALLMRAQTDRRQTRSFAVAVTSFLIGAITASIAVGAAYRYWSIPGQPLQVSFAIVYGHNPNTLIWPESLRWLRVAYWLLLPAAVVAWILPTVVGSLSRGWKAALRLPPAYWLFLSVSGLWTAVYFVRVPWLMLPFCASFLIHVTFLALGPAVMPLVERVSLQSYWSLLALLFFGAFAGYRFNNPQLAAEAGLVAGVFLILAPVLRATNGLLGTEPAAAVLTCLVLALIAINFATADYTVQIRNAYQYTAMAPIYHEPASESEWPVSRIAAFEGAVNTARVLAPRLAGRHYYFWYDGEDPLGMFFRSVGSMFYVWSTRDLLNERFQGINEDTVTSVMPRVGGRARDLLVLTRSPDVRVPGSPLELQWTEAFSTGGTRYYAHYFVVDVVRASAARVDFEPTRRRIDLASRFPCNLERASATRWYDSAFLAKRSSADLAALSDMFNVESDNAIGCLAAYRKLTESLGAAEKQSPYVRSTASCESELAIAEAYVAEAFDDPLRDETIPKLQAARIAQQERQVEFCQLAVGDIRRAYFEAVYGSNYLPAAVAGVARFGIDFEPTSRRMTLAGRFPCELEQSVAARWYDRGTKTHRTSADLHALESLFTAAQKGPIQCLSAYRTLTERLAAAEHTSPYAPSQASCESELSLADIYVSTVFDDALRQEALAALKIARVAQKEKQIELCRVAMGDIRRVYFNAIYGPTTPPAAALPLRLSAIGVDFEPTPRRIELASRFPCTVERAAATRWWDRGSKWTSADRKALEDLFRGERQDAIACLSAYKHLTQRLGAAEQRSAYLPATATCV